MTLSDTNVCGGTSWWLCQTQMCVVVLLDDFWYSYVKMPQWLEPLFSGGSCLVVGPGVESPEVEVLCQKHFSEKCIKYIWVSIFRLDHPSICTMLYMFIYFLSCKMISFNEQHKNLSLQKIFYLRYVCIFSLSYLEHGKDVSNSLSVLSITEVVCLMKLVPSFILVTWNVS